MKDKARNDGLIGALLMTTSALVVKILGFLYKVPLSHYLGDEGMGYYNSALSVYAIFYILAASAIPKAFSIILTRGRIHYCKKAFRISVISFSVFFSSLGIIASLILFHCAKSLATLIGVDGAYYAIKFIAPAVFVSSLGSLCRGYLLSVNKLLSVAISEALEATLKLLCGLFFVIYAKNKAVTLLEVSAFATYGISIGALVSFLFLFFNIIICKKPKHSFGNSNFSFLYFISSILKITIPLTLTSVLISLSNILDVSLISKGLLNAGIAKEIAVSQYGNYSTLVLPLFSFVTSLASAYSLSMFPKITRAYEERNETVLLKTIQDGIPMLLCFSVFLSCGFYFFGHDYFAIVFPNSDIALGTILIKIMSPAVVFITFSTIINTILEGIGKTFAPFWTLGIATLVKLPISYFAIKWFGILGSAFSNVISYGSGFIISYIMISKKLKVNLIKMKDLFQSIVVCFFSFLIPFLIRYTTKNIYDTRILLLVSPIICTIIFLISLRFIYKIGQNMTPKLTFSTK